MTINLETKKAVLERSGGLCEFRDEMDNRCGRSCYRAAYHHKTKRSQGGAHTEENLAFLCGFHHSLVHGIKEV